MTKAIIKCAETRTLGMTAGVAVASAILSSGTGSLVHGIDLAFAIAAVLALAGAATSSAI